MRSRKESNHRIFSDYERGFLEALIDGEGNLGILKNHAPMIAITNTSYHFLYKAGIIIGENVEIKRGTPTRVRPENHKAFYRLRIFGQKEVENILSQINLLVKRKQQDLILQALSLLREKSPDYRLRLEAIRKEMVIWNRRGVEK